MRSILALGFALVLLGCGAAATENGDSAAEGAAGTTVANPASGGRTAEPPLEGTVLETMDASNYTYVRLDTAEGEVWAAVPKTTMAVGQQVAIRNPMFMDGFESEALGRRFDTIVFGTLAGNDSGHDGPAATGANPHSSGGPMQLASGHSSAMPASDVGAVIEVSKAEGENGRTIAELFAQKSDFSGKSVRLHGKVVKYSGSIMGRNWIHLQDGTGDSAAGTHDITVTSNETTSVGQVVTIEGVVRLDKDFGAGYKYAVIVEDAKIVK